MICCIMRKKAVSIATVIVLFIIIIIAIKLGTIKLFNNAGENNFEKESVSNFSEKYTYEAYTTDKMILLNIGDEGNYERTNKTVNMNFNFKYIDYNISKIKPEEIYINFYKEDEKKDDNGVFVDDTYYVTIKYSVTNMIDSEDQLFSPQNFILGIYDDNGFVGKCEPRGYIIENITAVKGSITLKKDETALITTCYCVKKDILQNNIAVQACVMGESKAVKMPYFLINTDGVFE